MSKLEIKPRKEKKKILPLMMALGNKIIKEIGLVERIDSSVRWDCSRWNISPGNLIKALILGTFSDMRAPLVHVGARFEEVDITYLFGEEATAESINQYNIGEALERISEIDYGSLYESMALNAVQMNGITSSRLHADTTTISFYGEYDIDDTNLTEEEKQELLRIERGYNKDGRPLCNQVVVGHIVNEEGIVLSSQVMDGSTADTKWNELALERLKMLTEKDMKESVFVADSKLVTEELILKMTDGENKTSFVSRCPANFCNKLESRMIEKAYQSEMFQELGQYHKGSNASRYGGISFQESVHGRPLRLLVLRSSTLMQKAQQALERERQKLEPLIKNLEKKDFACVTDAQREYECFLNDKKTTLFDCDFEIQKETKEKWPRGRRTAESKPVIQENYHVRIRNIRNNPVKVEQYLRNESCIVLISNIMQEEVDDRTLLGIYKGQQVVENSFRLLKEPSLASVVYLKKPERIEALSMVLTLSLLIRAILQYRMRDGLKKHNEQNPKKVLKIGWNDKPLQSPTFRMLFEYTRNCYFEKESEENYSFSFNSEQTEYKVTSLLLLMNMSLEQLIQ